MSAVCGVHSPCQNTPWKSTTGSGSPPSNRLEWSSLRHLQRSPMCGTLGWVSSASRLHLALGKLFILNMARLGNNGVVRKRALDVFYWYWYSFCRTYPLPPLLSHGMEMAPSMARIVSRPWCTSLAIGLFMLNLTTFGGAWIPNKMHHIKGTHLRIRQTNTLWCRFGLCKIESIRYLSVFSTICTDICFSEKICRRSQDIRLVNWRHNMNRLGVVKAPLVFVESMVNEW